MIQRLDEKTHFIFSHKKHKDRMYSNRKIKGGKKETTFYCDTCDRKTRKVFIKKNVLKIFILWKIINNIYIYIYFIYFSSILNINEKNICYMLRFTQYFIQTFLLNPLCKWIKKLLLDKKKKKKSARYQNLVTNVFLSIVTISTSLKK